MSTTYLLLLGLALAPAAGAKPNVHAEALAPFLDERAVAVVHADVKSLDAARIAQHINALVPLSPLEKTGLERILAGLLKGLSDAGVHDVYGILNTSDHPGLVVIPLPKGVEAKAVLNEMNSVQAITGLSFEEIKGAVVGSDAEALRRLKEIRPVARPELARALTSDREDVAQLVVIPSAQTRRIVEEIMPTVPPEAGGASIRPLTQGLQWARFTLRDRPKPSLYLLVQTPGKEEARAVHELLAGMLKAMAKEKGVRSQFPHFEEAIPKLLPKVDGDQLSAMYELEK